MGRTRTTLPMRRCDDTPFSNLGVITSTHSPPYAGRDQLFLKSTVAQLLPVPHSMSSQGVACIVSENVLVHSIACIVKEYHPRKPFG